MACERYFLVRSFVFPSMLADTVWTILKRIRRLYRLGETLFQMWKDALRKPPTQVACKRCGRRVERAFSGEIFSGQVCKVSAHIFRVLQDLRFDAPS